MIRRHHIRQTSDFAVELRFATTGMAQPEPRLAMPEKVPPNNSKRATGHCQGSLPRRVTPENAVLLSLLTRTWFPDIVSDFDQHSRCLTVALVVVSTSPGWSPLACHPLPCTQSCRTPQYPRGPKDFTAVPPENFRANLEGAVGKTWHRLVPTTQHSPRLAFACIYVAIGSETAVVKGFCVISMNEQLPWLSASVNCGTSAKCCKGLNSVVL